MLKRLKHFYDALFLRNRLFFWLGGCALLFVAGYFYPPAAVAAPAGLAYTAVLTAIDVFLLFIKREGVTATREAPERFSNGDENLIGLRIFNRYGRAIRVTVLDELPVQFQRRDLSLSARVPAGETQSLSYHLRPVTRGEYHFGATRVFVRGPLGLAERRYTFEQPTMVPTYPSFLHLKKYQLAAPGAEDIGRKQTRRVGQTMEFDRLRPYSGDDYRLINWRATARRGELTVNQYQEERAQNIYCLIDMGRRMKTPFAGMTLLDYAINATLAIAGVALTRQDKAGLLTFAHKTGTFLRADRKKGQLTRITDALYNLQTRFEEPDYEKLYFFAERAIPNRSLLLLFTNFESVTSVRRCLPALQRLALRRLVVVVFFENTELVGLADEAVDGTRAFYEKAIAEKFVYEKKQIVRELNAAGVQALLTPPEKLTIAVLNRYIEIKARAML